MCLSTMALWVPREERLMEISEGEGRCRRKCCVGREEEKHDEVSTTVKVQSFTF